MKIIFNKAFLDSSYCNDCAAAPGRIGSIISVLENIKDYEMLNCVPADEKDILLAHSSEYIEKVKQDPALYKMALLAAGAAIKAAQTGYTSSPCFACLRPPGHHASYDSSWGYCVFSNMAVGLLKLRKTGFIKSAMVIDIDAHTGDGTINILSDDPSFVLFNPFGENSKEIIECIENKFNEILKNDIIKPEIIGVCAGFDNYLHDLGKKLTTFDFYHIGKLIKKFCNKSGHDRRFAILEGGYYQPDLGENVKSFCNGFF